MSFIVSLDEFNARWYGRFWSAYKLGEGIMYAGSGENYDEQLDPIASELVWQQLIVCDYITEVGGLWYLTDLGVDYIKDVFKP